MSKRKGQHRIEIKRFRRRQEVERTVQEQAALDELRRRLAPYAEAAKGGRA